MDPGQLNNLVVMHRPKDAAGRGIADEAAARLSQQGLLLSTCLREIAILNAGQDFRADVVDAATDILRGSHAYAFLLQAVTGLHSSVPGETNVQGQFKRAWEGWRATADASSVRGIHWIVQRVLADCRAVRKQFLQGIGGHSYGTLARKLLAPETDARILFVGAGDLAASMLPMFATWEHAVWSRAVIRPADIAASRAFAPDDAAAAAHWATHFIITTPADAHNDQLWSGLSAPHLRKIVHLGRRRAEPGPWHAPDSAARFHDLDDLFELRRQQSTRRALQIMQARRACVRLAENYFGEDGPASARRLLAAPAARQA